MPVNNAFAGIFCCVTYSNNPLNDGHVFSAYHLILRTGLIIMPGHFQSGVSGGILDAVLADAKIIYSGTYDLLQTDFHGRYYASVCNFLSIIARQKIILSYN